MYPPTPDAIHQIALDRRTDALATATAHRQMRDGRRPTTWASITTRLRSAVRRQPGTESPLTAPIEPVQEA